MEADTLIADKAFDATRASLGRWRPRASPLSSRREPTAPRRATMTESFMRRAI